MKTEDLKTSSENYKIRNGYFPAKINTKQIYITRENQKWCKERNLDLMGKSLGRPTTPLCSISPPRFEEFPNSLFGVVRFLIHHSRLTSLNERSTSKYEATTKRAVTNERVSNIFNENMKLRTLKASAVNRNDRRCSDNLYQAHLTDRNNFELN